MKEMEVYTYKQWGIDGTFKAKPGQVVDGRTFSEMRDGVPPLHYSKSYMQVGEPYGYDFEKHKTTFTTFVREKRGWVYVGEFPDGEGMPEPKTFDDLKFEYFCNNPDWKFKAAKMHFPNGYGVSVLLGNEFYSNGVDTYEVGVLKDGALCYDTPIANDVLPNRTKEEVTEIMKEVQKLWWF